MQIVSKYRLEIIIFALFIFLAVVFFVKNTKPYSGAGLWSQYEVREMTINQKKMKLVVASNSEQFSQGLMYVRKPVKEFDGMVFLFPDSTSRSFWNKNTFVDLKLYWLDNGKVIGTSNLPSIEQSKKIVIVESPGPADTVIEEIL